MAKEKIEWRDSPEKQQLIRDILSGQIDPELKPMQVWPRVPYLHKWGKKNFGSRLRSLQKSLQEKTDRAAFDRAALVHDRQLFPKQAYGRDGQPRWEGWRAAKKLSKDVKRGKHMLMTPKELQESRPGVYTLFSYDVFKGHIKQEMERRKKIVFYRRLKEHES